jgi:hypothetical protein
VFLLPTEKGTNPIIYVQFSLVIYQSINQSINQFIQYVTINLTYLVYCPSFSNALSLWHAVELKVIITVPCDHCVSLTLSLHQHCFQLKATEKFQFLDYIQHKHVCLLLHSKEGKRGFEGWSNSSGSVD